ncbi:hypothetical protein KSP39_PZI012454 [Platanthera zijinensis]|uniref:Conserved oligomeric Golgi complex subunit 2 n=1 Tax=Platanthera zijinensis TaxID=2320716 RepID=A0AAP0BF47_9ASPA
MARREMSVDRSSHQSRRLLEKEMVIAKERIWQLADARSSPTQWCVPRTPLLVYKTKKITNQKMQEPRSQELQAPNSPREDFDAESYIADLRTFVPLESLGAELRSHLSTLKSELVELINRDYADFVSLSTRLVDVDSSIARMRDPLVDFRDKIGAFRAAVENSLSSLRGGLHQRAEASAAREILERLLDTFHVVSKREGYGSICRRAPQQHLQKHISTIVRPQVSTLSDKWATYLHTVTSAREQLKTHRLSAAGCGSGQRRSDSSGEGKGEAKYPYVEKLIKDLPTTLSIESNTDLVHLEKGILSNENSLQPAENGNNLRVTQSILLERIASEMNRIKFSISNAKKSPTVHGGHEEGATVDTGIQVSGGLVYRLVRGSDVVLGVQWLRQLKLVTNG